MSARRSLNFMRIAMLSRTSVSAEAYGEWRLSSMISCCALMLIECSHQSVQLPVNCDASYYALPAPVVALPRNAKKAFVPPVIIKTDEQKDRLKAPGCGKLLSSDRRRWHWAENYFGRQLGWWLAIPRVSPINDRSIKAAMYSTVYPCEVPSSLTDPSLQGCLVKSFLFSNLDMRLGCTTRAGPLWQSTIRFWMSQSLRFAPNFRNDLNIVIGAMKEVNANAGSRVINQGRTPITFGSK